MRKTITLSEQEATLRQLLLDVSNYIGTLDGHSRPQLRFTGGWVRDKLLGVGSKDIDIAIDSMTGYHFGMLMKQYLEQPDTQAKYPKSVKLSKIEANPDKSKHLETTTAHIMGLDIDLVNLRKETYTEHSRNPQMEFGTPQDDAMRRDATVNAMFYHLDNSGIEDFTGRGFNDMERGLIKTPLSPYQTFKDDPLRVLRAIRFASRLGYSIDPEDERAMSDPAIWEEFKLKITRERVGIEITKMLRGPNPRQALHLIDRLGLYKTIFTIPGSESSPPGTALSNWQKAYDELQTMVNVESEDFDGQNAMVIVKSILFNKSEEVYPMWLLCAFVPWARLGRPAPKKPGGVAPTLAKMSAQEGIKADNDSAKLIDNAASHLESIIQARHAVIKEESTTNPLKRKQDDVSRQEQGLFIREWGSNWRCSVMYAILTEITESAPEQHHELLEQYARWLSTLKDLDLLEAYQLKPLVDGKKLTKEFETKDGPWVGKALKVIIAWQLRTPDNLSPEAAICENREQIQSLIQDGNHARPSDVNGERDGQKGKKKKQGKGT
ncbi:CCA tRNA nucleotidyltransferase, mitochondrial [Xanthoria parietina]